MSEALLDTDILSEVLKQKDDSVVAMASLYLQEHGRFSISSITRYEILRGLKHKGATRQVRKFEEFCRHSVVHAVTDEILDRTADLWVLGERGGRPHRDADLIIAATALEHDRVLVTGNTPHFEWIPNLSLENWRAV
ncbi:type II toxin-antitoxin system VapC family toxin [Stratiformator vulcanicus]|uniref:Ribonuclease VapC n=1 Tax=Stratiformator vulcanicus TaxID=2527980 RepID=A0A517R3E2_9PLAN|nr:type II toxin-antitoxin system VapC family toxin [Stratiformator vulcanicus]QDT38394.1 tRNA(fMet)-specific endonuclease VapC [Stratiformator vulcanicus]